MPQSKDPLCHRGAFFAHLHQRFHIVKLPDLGAIGLFPCPPIGFTGLTVQGAFTGDGNILLAIGIDQR